MYVDTGGLKDEEQQRQSEVAGDKICKKSATLCCETGNARQSFRQEKGPAQVKNPRAGFLTRQIEWLLRRFGEDWSYNFSLTSSL